MITGYILGFSFLRITGAHEKYHVRGTVHILIAGLCILTVYAQIFSLFYRVSLLANIILCLICIMLVLVNGSGINNEISGSF